MSQEIIQKTDSITERRKRCTHKVEQSQANNLNTLQLYIWERDRKKIARTEKPTSTRKKQYFGA